VNRIVNEIGFDRSMALIHCFSYGPEELLSWQGKGGWVSFAGNLTRPTATTLVEALKVADWHRILFETDSPFLLPEPLRSRNPGAQNEPAHLWWVVRFAAGVLGRSEEDIWELSLKNGCEFWGVKAP
jgi:TatD DNase family protein